MSRAAVFQFFSFFFYLLVQVLILKNVILFNTAFCFLYIVFLLSLPVDFNPLLLMLVGFVLGISIDAFYDSLGVHAFAMVVVAYLRNYWLTLITPQSGYEAGMRPALGANGFQWFLVYVIPLIFIHHVVLFYLEAFSFAMFWFTFLKVVASVFFTLIAILVLQYTFTSNERRI